MKSKLVFLAFLTCFLPSIVFGQTNNCEDVNPNSGKLIEKGIEAYEKEAYDEAIGYFIRIFPGDTNYATAQYELGMTYGAKKDYLKEEQIARQLLKENKGNAIQNYNMLGNALDDQEKSEEALLVYDEGIAKYPNNYLIIYNKGLSLFRAKKYVEAEKTLIRSAGLNPFHQGSHYFIGLINLMGKRYVQGMMAMQYALLLNNQTTKYNYGIKYIDESSILQFPTAEDEIKLPDNIESAGDYATVNEIYVSLLALNAKYKPKKLPNLRLVRQMSIFFDNIESINPTDQTFYTTYYLPFYKKVKSKKLSRCFFAQLLSNINTPEMEKFVASEKGNAAKFTEAYGEFLRETGSKTLIKQKDKELMCRLEYYERGGVKFAYELNESRTEITDNGVVLSFYESGSLSNELGIVSGKLQGESRSFRKDGSLFEVSTLVDAKEEGPSTEYYSTGEVLATKSYKSGELHGEVKIFYPDGKLKMVYNMNNGIKNGPEKYYYNDGKLADELAYLNGNYDGPIKSYYHNGKLEYDYSYKNGTLEGDFKSYYPNGNVKEEKKFVDGSIVGKYAEYYSNGKVKQEGVFDEKYKRTGVWKEYFYNGILKNEYTYMNGEKQGKGVEYARDGKKHYEYEYVGGNYTSMKFYGENGEVIGDYKEDKNVLKYTFTTIEGIKVFDGSLKNGKRDGQWTTYFTSTKGVLRTIPYKNGLEEGQWMDYYADGVIKGNYAYKAGVQEGTAIVYYPDGETMKTYSCCTDDKICGNFVGYFPNGDKKYELYYLDGYGNGPLRRYDLLNRTYQVEGYTDDVVSSEHCYDTLGREIFVIKSTEGLVPFERKYPNGKIRGKGTYLNGELHDSLIYYYPDGKLRSTAYYENGKREGKLMIYNHLGVKIEDRTYENDELEGSLTVYYSNGKVSNVYNYMSGQEYGFTQYYYPNGIKEFEIEKEDGQRQGWGSWFDETGSEGLKMLYYDNAPAQYTYKDKSSKWINKITLQENGGKVLAYHANGKKFYETTYAGNEQSGTSTMYFSNGNVYKSVVFLNGVFNGPRKVYYSNGKMAESENYWMDELHGIQKYYGENGNILTELSFEFGNLNGPCKYYSASGKLLYTCIFYQDEVVDVIY